jgi:hypothetical protein
VLRETETVFCRVNEEGSCHPGSFRRKLWFLPVQTAAWNMWYEEGVYIAHDLASTYGLKQRDKRDADLKRRSVYW